MGAIDLTQLGTLLSALAVPIGSIGAVLLALDRRKTRRLRRQDRQLTVWEDWGEDVFSWRDWADNERSVLADQVRGLGGEPKLTPRPRFPVRRRDADADSEESQ